MQLINSRSQKVKVIKAVRELTGWNSRRQKPLRIFAPDVLHEVGNKVEAMHYRAEFSPIDARDENA